MVRYRSLSRHLKEVFGGKVKKIPLDAGLTCPNRDGTIGFGGCIYCDAKGSGTGLHQTLNIREQLKLFLEKFKARGYRKFILYFQSYTNTYAPIDTLRQIYNLVHEDESIVGLAIGTRPDCLDEIRLKLIKNYQERGYYTWVEVGLQSTHDETLKLINRGHTFKDFLKAYEQLKAYDLPTVVHIIFGLPGETKAMMLQTVKYLSSLEVDGIKFHALYILKNTPLTKLYLEGRYAPLTLEDYAQLVAKSLSLLPPKTVIHRLTSDPPKEELVAPEWLLKKQEIIKRIHQILEEKNLFQGKFYQKNHLAFT